ncbi:MAG: outer membrane beta-barrel protein [Pseudomonadales bacterium]
MNTVIAAFLTMTALLLSPSATQAAWVIEPTLELTSGYDDNVRLREQNEQDAIVTTATAQAQMRSLTERSEIALVAGAGYVAYSNVGDGETPADDIDNEDVQYLRLRAHRDTDRTQWGLTGSARRDQVFRRITRILDPLDGSLADSTPGAIGVDDDRSFEDSLDTDDVDFSAVRDQARRIRFEVSPYLQVAFSERSNARVSLVRSQRFFDSDGERLGLRNTQTTGADVTFDRAMSPLASVNLTVGYALLESDGREDSDTYRATIGWRQRLSAATEVAIDVGANQVENDLVDETLLAYRISATRNMPLSRFLVQVERSAIASPFGGVVEADRVSARYRRSISDRVEFNLSIYGYRSERIGAGTEEEREYVDLSPELFWRMTPNWSVGGAYTFRWTDRQERAGTATSNGVSVSLRYQPPRRI